MMNDIDPLTQMEVAVKMRVAARIQDLIEKRKWSKKEFAAKVGKQPSEISKWLSGTHNFTIDTLCEIATVLMVDFFELFEGETRGIKIVKQYASIESTGQWTVKDPFAGFERINNDPSIHNIFLKDVRNRTQRF